MQYNITLVIPFRAITSSFGRAQYIKYVNVKYNLGNSVLLAHVIVITRTIIYHMNTWSAFHTFAIVSFSGKIPAFKMCFTFNVRDSIIRHFMYFNCF